MLFLSGALALVVLSGAQNDAEQLFVSDAFKVAFKSMPVFKNIHVGDRQLANELGLVLADKIPTSAKPGKARAFREVIRGRNASVMLNDLLLFEKIDLTTPLNTNAETHFQRHIVGGRLPIVLDANNELREGLLAPVWRFVGVPAHIMEIYVSSELALGRILGMGQFGLAQSPKLISAPPQDAGESGHSRARQGGNEVAVLLNESANFDQEVARQTITGAVMLTWLCGLAYFVLRTIGRKHNRESDHSRNKRPNGPL